MTIQILKGNHFTTATTHVDTHVESGWLSLHSGNNQLNNAISYLILFFWFVTKTHFYDGKSFQILCAKKKSTHCEHHKGSQLCQATYASNWPISDTREQWDGKPADQKHINKRFGYMTTAGRSKLKRIQRDLCDSKKVKWHWNNIPTWIDNNQKLCLPHNGQ